MAGRAPGGWHLSQFDIGIAMTSSAPPQRSTGLPSAQAKPSQEERDVSDALQVLLDAHPASRVVLRHLTYLAATFRRTGYAALDGMPLDVLGQALTQLQIAASDQAPSSVQMLALRMENAAARREALVRKASRADGAPSDILSDERMMVSEGRMSDFIRLAEGPAKSGDPGA
jgi:hypothetical protein